jgi:hypothetical protein
MALSDDGLPDLHHTTRARTILPFCLTTRQHSSSLTDSGVLGPTEKPLLKLSRFIASTGINFQQQFSIDDGE